MPLTSKLPRVGTTIFTQMSQLAHEHDAINLSQGFPDFAADEYLLQRLAEHSRQGRNQYAPMPGLPALRERIAELVADTYGRRVSADEEVTVTSGATEALFVAIQAVVQAGDEAIVLDPAYDSYAPAVELAGGSAVHIPLQAPDFRVDWQRVEDAVTPKTRLIVVNTPHNPTGMVFSPQDWRHLQSLVCRHGLWCVSDEVYEHLVFDGMPRLSANGYEALAARSFVVSSFGKTFHVTGWKLGYCVAPPALTAEFRKIHQYVTFASFTPAQHAIADMLSERPRCVAELADFYQQKRDLFADALQRSRFRPLPCAGTYFQLMDYGDVSAEDDVAYCRRLTVEHKVAAIPLSVFYRNPPPQRIVRFCFAKTAATLQQAAEILCRV